MKCSSVKLLPCDSCFFWLFHSRREYMFETACVIFTSIALHGSSLHPPGSGSQHPGFSSGLCFPDSVFSLSLWSSPKFSSSLEVPCCSFTSKLFCPGWILSTRQNFLWMSTCMLEVRLSGSDMSRSATSCTVSHLYSNESSSDIGAG